MSGHYGYHNDFHNKDTHFFYSPLPTRPRSSHCASHLKVACRRRFSGQMARIVLVAVLLLTIVINLTFILESSFRFKDKAKEANHLDYADEDDGEDDADPNDTGEKVQVSVTSSQSLVRILVGQVIVVNDEKNRGIHIVVLHQATGSVMAHRWFDTYSAHEDEALVLFLNMISPGRILIFAVLDEGSFQLKDAARNLLTLLGSQKMHNFGWRDMWVMITVKAASLDFVPFGEILSKSESLSSWAEPVHISVYVNLINNTLVQCKQWPKDKVGARRQYFCDRHEGYGSVCSCTDAAPIVFNSDLIPDPDVANRIKDVPIAVIASNRPHYLYRMLRSLLSVSGVQVSQIVVFIDGYFDEPLEVAHLFGIQAIHHAPLGSKNARISQHYKSSLTAIFDMHPQSRFAMILEEDLDVSPDILYFFGQLLPLYDNDTSIYCISAWNDHGYDHSSGDASLVNRVETMPGLGWVLKKTLFKGELEGNWPSVEKQWDWDMWMRLPSVRKGRECLVPDVSRTYHFGSKGLNMNPYFQEVYFKKRVMNTMPHVVLDVDKLVKGQYEIRMKALLSIAVPLDHSKNPCVVSLDHFISTFHAKTSQPRTLFISMKNANDFNTWKSIAKCLKIWDLDVRGVHQCSWRLYVKGAPLLIVGVPASPYSIFMEPNIKPLFISPMI